MKKSMVLSLATIAGMWLINGCKETTDVTMEQIHQVQDTVTHMIPGVTAIDVKVEQQKNLKVIIGDAAFYGATEAQQQQAALKVGETAMILFGDANEVKTGKLIITKENRQSAWDKDPADGKVIDMKIDSLREHDEVLLVFFSAAKVKR